MEEKKCLQMKCRKCATELEPWHKFCCSCGREVEEGDGAGEQTAKRSTKSVPMETESGRSQEQSEEEQTSVGKLSDSFPRTKAMNGYSNCEVSAIIDKGCLAMPEASNRLLE